MFLRRDLCFVICSLDLDISKYAKDHRLFILITHKSTKVGKSHHMDNSHVEFCCTRNHFWPLVMFFCTRSLFSQTFAVFN